MSESQFPTFRKISQTPMRDLVRLRLTGRLDWKSLLRASAQPLPVQELIARVVMRTHLWRLEKAAVAEELIAHFSDGLQTGSSDEELMERFGDPQLAAKLIRRSKRRCRPMAWHAWNISARILALVVGVYVIFLIRFFMGRPAPAVDYIAKLNEPIIRAAPADRAWPLWRTAILAIAEGKDERGNLQFKYEITKLGASRDKLEWKEQIAWLQNHTAAISTARLAAQRPMMGFVLGSSGSINDPALFTSSATSESYFPLLSVLLPHLNYLRCISGVLSLDAKLAAENGNGEQFEADFIAMNGLSRQLRQADGILITQLVGMIVEQLAIDRLQSALHTHPEIFSDQQLIRLAHTVAGPKVAGDLVAIGGERYYFDDIVQRVYTDDGHGDGHITQCGISLLPQVYTAEARKMYDIEDITFQAASALPLVVASRAELMAKYNQLLDQNQANFAKPIRMVDLAKLRSQIDSIDHSVGQQMRYSVMLPIIPNFTRVQENCEFFLGHRDGTVVAIALELFHRRHGTYPASLDGLTQSWLPEIPADRITGNPVKYRLIDGEPIVYSVGANRIDDGGKPTDKKAFIHGNASSMWETTAPVPTGDWVLYPPDPADDPQ